MELALNAYANWPARFRALWWNWIDSAIAVLSVVGLATSGLSMRFVVLLRCCRVVRIFGKLRAVIKIFAALSYAIVPMSLHPPPLFSPLLSLS